MVVKSPPVRVGGAVPLGGGLAFTTTVYSALFHFQLAFGVEAALNLATPRSSSSSEK